jgi:multidrug efflux pump subunit AcrA (membrane-fusion protein)
MNPDENKDHDNSVPITIVAESREWSRPSNQWRGRRNLVIVASVFVVLILTVLLVWYFKSRQTAPSEETSVVVSVKVAKAEKQPIAAQVSALGSVTPRDRAEVAAKVSAQIKKMALLKNKFVHAGDVIATLESRDLQAQRAEALAALNEARANERSVVTGTIPQTNAQDQRTLRGARAKVVNAQATYQRRRALTTKAGFL